MSEKKQDNFPNNHLFTTKRSDEIAAPIDARVFMQGVEGHMIVAPGSNISLKIPKIANIPFEQVQIQRPTGMPSYINGFMESIPYPDMTLSRLHDVVCLPSGLAIAQKDIILKDCFTSDWSTDFHPLLNSIGENGYIPKIDITPKNTIEEKCIYIDYMHQNHYGHFIADVLSKSWAYHFCIDHLNMKDLSVLLTKSTEGFITEILIRYGIPEKAFVWIDEPVLVRELLVPTRSFMVQEYTTPLAAGIWRRLRDSSSLPSGGPKRVYISRSRNPQRILVNENAVEDIFRKEGFHIIHPQNLSIAEQIHYIANAELIAGASGSNMFNLAFQKNLKSAFIFGSPLLIHYHDVFFNSPYESTIQYFVGEIDREHPHYNPENVHTPWRIADLEQFAQCIRQWISDTTNPVNSSDEEIPPPSGTPEGNERNAVTASHTLPSLNDIGLRTGTDKSSRHHNFLKFYERFLNEMRLDEIKVLEVGVFRGDSLRMWEEYFPNAQVIGLDIDPETLQHSSERIRIELVNQSDPIALTDVARRYGPFHLIVDDGSHYWNDQIITLQYMFPHLVPGGFYILEDIDTSYGHYCQPYGRGDVSAAQYLHQICDVLVGDQALEQAEIKDAFVRSCASNIEFLAYYPRTSLFRRKIR